MVRIVAMTNRPLLAIDPGLNSLGWAYWYPLSRKGMIPDATGLLHAPRRLSLTERARYLAIALEKEAMHPTMCGVHHSRLCGCFGRFIIADFDIVSEYPAYHGRVKGWDSGDLQKLVFLVGVIAGYFHKAMFTPVTPADWKGQLPKDVVIRRLEKKLGKEYTKNYEKDIWDAVGIGLWKLGKF
jgi:hypothetical protein